MAISNPHVEEGLRQAFKRFNPFMVMVYRLGLGWWLNAYPETGGRIMVIQHIGRKSGKIRYTPVNYAMVEDELYCTAGFGQLSDWYRNMLANPQVEVWLPDGWWAGVAEDISDSPDRLFLLRQVLIGSGIVAPLAGVNPHTLSDSELDRLTESYRLIRIKRTEARTGFGAPADLSWVWVYATIGLFLLLFMRRRK